MVYLWLIYLVGGRPTPLKNTLGYVYIYDYIWLCILLVGGRPTPLKNMSSSVGMMKFPIVMEK